jgi:pimeloyl-ACP methyl ester carboxylesterase
MGDRTHLLTRGCGLQLHILDVANLLDYEDLEAVVVGGHGYGGMVGTGVAWLRATRVVHRVYLDAPVPEPGESLIEVMPSVRRWLATANIEEGWRVSPAPPSQWGVESPVLASWMRARLSSFAIASCTESIGSPAATVRQRRSYLRGVSDEALSQLGLRLAAAGGWEVRQLAGPLALLSPDAIAGVLVELTR